MNTAVYIWDTVAILIFITVEDFGLVISDDCKLLARFLARKEYLLTHTQVRHTAGKKKNSENLGR